MFTPKDIKTIKEGVVEYNLHFNRIYIREGYLSKVAAILERVLYFEKNIDYKLNNNKSDPYSTNTHRDFNHDGPFIDVINVQENLNTLLQINEIINKPEPETKNYEPYVMIATLILFILIISKS